MKRICCSIAALAAVMGLAGGAAAAEGRGLYLRADAGASIGGSPGGGVVDGTGFKGDLGTSALVEFGVGMQLPYNLRTDLTVGYRPNFGIDSKESVMGLPVTAKADLATWTVLANLYYDIQTGTAFTPYVGAGLGVAIHDLGKVTYGFAGAPEVETGKTTHRFAWTLGLGTAYALTDAVKLDLAYRYLDAGKFTTGGSTPDGAVPPTHGNVTAHELKIGVRYQF